MPPGAWGCGPLAEIPPRFWGERFWNRKKSFINPGPRGPAVMLFWLSATGMPLSVVSVGRLATDYSCIARRCDPGNATAHGSVVLLSRRRWLRNGVCKRPGARGTLSIRLAMTLALLL